MTTKLQPNAPLNATAEYRLVPDERGYGVGQKVTVVRKADGANLRGWVQGFAVPTNGSGIGASVRVRIERWNGPEVTFRVY